MFRDLGKLNAFKNWGYYFNNLRILFPSFKAAILNNCLKRGKYENY